MSMAHNPIGNNTGATNAAVGGHMNRFLSKQWEDYHRKSQIHTSCHSKKIITVYFTYFHGHIFQ